MGVLTGPWRDPGPWATPLLTVLLATWPASRPPGLAARRGRALSPGWPPGALGSARAGAPDAAALPSLSGPALQAPLLWRTQGLSCSGRGRSSAGDSLGQAEARALPRPGPWAGDATAAASPCLAAAERGHCSGAKPSSAEPLGPSGLGSLRQGHKGGLAVVRAPTASQA